MLYGEPTSPYAAVALLVGKLHGWDCLRGYIVEKEDSEEVGDGGGCRHRVW